jgi:hypothetical protein
MVESFPSAEKITKINSNRYQVDFDPHLAVVVGTDTGGKLVPRATFRRWAGECWLEVLYDRELSSKTVTEQKSGADITGLKLDISNNKESIQCNCIDGKNGAEKGGFEYDILLSEKPLDEIVNTGTDETPVLLKANEFVLRYRDSGNLRFLYQEPYSTATLSGEDLAKVVTRDDTGGWDKNGKKVVDIPDWCNKSWAVYQVDHVPAYKSKNEGEKYQGGKVLHIHRPKAIDDNGDSVWCDLDIDTVNKTMKVTVPQSFLDTAVYPVRVDPTFGYTTLGGTNYNFEDDIIGRANVGPGESGIVTSLHIGLDSDWDSGESVAAALYTDVATPALQSPQSDTDDTGHGTAAFVSFNVTGSLNVTDQNYIIGAWTASSFVNMRRDSGGASGDSKYELTVTGYPTWPSTLTESSSSNLYSTYATYSGAWVHYVHGVGAGAGKQTFTTPGTDTFQVPAGVTSIIVKIWGAGGGGGGGGIGPTGDGDGGPGYAGGYAQATLSVTPLDTLNIIIGGGGDFGRGASVLSGGGGAGGGITGLWDGVTSTRANALLIAGGGGGGGGGDNSSATAGGNGGGGGADVGQTGGGSGASTGGTGGTQIAGGFGGGGEANGENGEIDGTYEGGDGGQATGTQGAVGGTGTQNGGDGGDEITSGFSGGGGGGAGYYGGGGGGSSTTGDAGGGGGGGGSNEITGTSTTNTQATSQTPPNTGDPDYDGAYGGGGNGGTQGGNDGSAGEGGRMVISWDSPSVVGKVHGVSVDNIAKVHGVPNP